MSDKVKSIEERGQSLDEIEHVIHRPGTWIGSTINELLDFPVFIPSKNRIIVQPNMAYNAGLLKLIDEVLSNSIDEHRRPDNEVLYRVDHIKIFVTTAGHVVISDNGGIPVEKHKKFSAKIKKPTLFPEMIFGHLRTGTNYDDTINRSGVGTNGLGAKLTNILSKRFEVQTHDGKNSVSIVWTNNMSKINRDIVKYPETCGFDIKKENNPKEHGTTISFDLDLEKFDMEAIQTSTLRIIQKRCIDAAASNPGLNIRFETDAYDGKLNSDWCFNSFKEYIRLYISKDMYAKSMEYKTGDDSIVIVPENLGFNVGFVNGALCSEGTHINKICNQLRKELLSLCEANDMKLITKTDIDNHLSVFVDTVIFNPKYDSQSKDKLATKLDTYKLKFSTDYIRDLKKSTLFDTIKDFYQIKYLAEKKKETKKLNNQLKNIKTKKLIKCVSKGDSNELWLFEGTSASNGFRKAHALNQAAYLLRGKIKNTFNLDRMQIFENQELREVIIALKLQFDNPKQNLKNCAFDKIVVSSDMDFDGNHICGLLIAFFAVHFPELIRAGKLYRAISPIITARKGTGKSRIKKYFYTMNQYHAEEKNLKGYDILYTKGLGGLEDDDYYKMLREPRLLRFTMDNVDDFDAIKVWFDKSTGQRKELLLEDNEI